VSPTGVVLAVVRRGDRICLARRSRLVATSQGRWSVITGYLEPDVEPEIQAWTEAAEELGLQPPTLTLVRQLPPVPLTSAAGGLEFLVHPFLFECAESDEVVLNWENDDVAWVDPDRLAELECIVWQRPHERALLAGEGRDHPRSSSDGAARRPSLQNA
jgi:8-oxo-dGTP pyrophosphatase MutT (NUDIX family)